MASDEGATVSGLKRCPFCAEEIQAAAIVCKHCGRDLSTPARRFDQQPPSQPVSADKLAQQATQAWVLKLGLLAIGALFVVSMIMKTLQPDVTVSPPPRGPVPSPSSSVAASQPPAPTPPPAGGMWIRSGSTSAMDDSTGITFSLEAINEIEGWPRQRVRPTLIVRCHERRTDVYVVTGMSSQPVYGELDKGHVRVRFDDEQSRNELWSESTDSKALFAPNPVSMARRIAKAKTLLLEITPFNSSPDTIRFYVSGFDAHLDDLVKTCRWAK
jgi:type VI secretion system protein VasI